MVSRVEPKEALSLKIWTGEIDVVTVSGFRKRLGVVSERRPNLQDKKNENRR